MDDDWRNMLDDTILGSIILAAGGRFLPLLSLVVGCFGCATATSESAIQINEFMAANETVVADENGEFHDWIELYNGDDSARSLEGVFITDDLGAATLWALPDELSIEASGYLVLWASGETTTSQFHLPFKLDRSGEAIGLYRDEGETIVTLDAVSYIGSVPDESIARETDGDDHWVVTDQPTPGAPND